MALRHICLTVCWKKTKNAPEIKWENSGENYPLEKKGKNEEAKCGCSVQIKNVRPSHSSSPTVTPSREPGWLEGELEGKRGLIPENYVEML